MNSRSQIVAALIGCGIGVVGVQYIDDAVYDLYDSLYPVAKVEARQEYADMTRVGYRMYVDKYRDCELQRVLAYDLDKAGYTIRLRIEREDSASLGLPPGQHVGAKLWYVVPPPTERLQLYMIHDCGSRQVRTPIKVLR